MKFRVFWDVLIALMMEAARTSETSVDIDLRTRQYIPEDSELVLNVAVILFPYIFTRLLTDPGAAFFSPEGGWV
jgi:hypothetical protein